jgi:hypothetical protein
VELNVKLEELKTVQQVQHRRYGKCQVISIQYSFGNFFGVVLKPLNASGIGKLNEDAGKASSHYLETSLKVIRAM